MSDPYLGEIRIFAGNYAPEGWAFCDGQLLSISEYDALFALIGTTYGGDGVSNFALPDLRGRLPIHMGTNPKTGTTYPLAQGGGTETVTLTKNQLPAHAHQAMGNKMPDGSKDKYQSSPKGGVWAKVFDDPGDPPEKQYVTDLTGITIGAMRGDAIAPAGSDKPAPHDNIMPYRTVSFIISLMGYFPERA